MEGARKQEPELQERGASNGKKSPGKLRAEDWCYPGRPFQLPPSRQGEETERVGEGLAPGDTL